MKARQKKKLSKKLQGPFDFRKKLVEQPRTKGYGYLRINEWIFFNDEVAVSIQASDGHYCWPRETAQVHTYECMEVAFFKCGEMVSVEEVVTNKSVKESFKYYFDLGVYAYVPIQFIQKMYSDLLLQKGLKVE